MVNQIEFRKAIGTDKIDFVPGSLSASFVPQSGDIFVWRKSDGIGHTGIVYDVSGEKVTILEAIGNTGSADERFNRNNGGTKLTGVSRTAVYNRTGGALHSHKGWKGYFRPNL